jgi:hypothetical protein
MMTKEADGFLDKNLWKQIFIDHILSDIRWAIDAKRDLVAAQLLLAAIDVIAGLERPSEQEKTSGDNFIKWCDLHMRLKGRNYTLTGLDLWGARCGFLHGYTPLSTVVRQGKARMLAYVDEANEVVMTDNPDKGLAIVSLKALWEAFCQGVLASMKRANRDSEIAKLVNPRLNLMFYSVSLPDHLKNI